jgi:tetratricopeptide (TPR) repeat protein
MRAALLCLLLAGAASGISPALAQHKDPANAALVDQLLAQLHAAPTEEEAGRLEHLILEQWMQAGTPAVTLLMTRGQHDLEAGALQDAQGDFDAAIALQPDLAEAWNRRAIADFMLGDYDSSIRDIGETLAREPRHFGALQGLAQIAEKRGDWKGALAAWKKVMELAPKTPGGEDRLKELTRRAFGDET